MADDFSFNCPRCGKEPKRGKFLGSEIWHDACLIDDLVEKFQNGTPREEVEKTLKRVKDKGIEQNVGLKCGWPEYQPPKSQEEIEAEYQAELDAAEAKKEADDALKAAGEAEGEEAKAAAEAAAAEAQAKADDASKAAEGAKIAPSDNAGQTPANQGVSAQSAASPAAMAPMGMPQYASYPSMAPPQMASMPMMGPSKGESLKPAPTDKTVRKIAISAMQFCLKSMRKNIDYGKLLFKLLKEFNWEEIEKDPNEEEVPEIEEIEEEIEEEINEKTEDVKPFLVEN